MDMSMKRMANVTEASIVFHSDALFILGNDIKDSGISYLASAIKVT